MARRLRLGAFVFVVWEHEIVAATVEIKTVTEERERHRRALDVPARPARAPRRIPIGFAGLRRFPKREVHWALLAFIHLNARAGAFDQVFQTPARELAVALVRTDGEVHAFTLDHVRPARLDEFTDQVDHRVDELSGPRHVVGTAHVEPIEFVPIRGLVPIGQLAFGGPLGRGPSDDLVLDVGHVPHETNGVASPFEIPTDDVVHQRGASVADMRNVIDRRPAHVDRHLTRDARRQFDVAFRQGVKDPDHGAEARRPPSHPPPPFSHQFRTLWAAKHAWVRREWRPPGRPPGRRSATFGDVRRRVRREWCRRAARAPARNLSQARSNNATAHTAIPSPLPTNPRVSPRLGWTAT